MHVPPVSSQAPLAPVSNTLTTMKKRCINCNDWITLSGRNTGNDAKRKFCSELCKNEYNRFGSAYGPLKAKLEKVIREAVKAETPKAVAPELKRIVHTEEFRELMHEAGFVHRSQIKRRPEELRAQALRDSIADLDKQLANTIEGLDRQLREIRRDIRRERTNRRAAIAKVAKPRPRPRTQTTRPHKPERRTASKAQSRR
jgi:hypothetical protein